MSRLRRFLSEPSLFWAGVAWITSCVGLVAALQATEIKQRPGSVKQRPPVSQQRPAILAQWPAGPSGGGASTPSYYCGNAGLATGLEHLWTFDNAADGSFGGMDYVGSANLTRANTRMIVNSGGKYKNKCTGDSTTSWALPGPQSTWELSGDRTWAWWAMRPSSGQFDLTNIYYGAADSSWKVTFTNTGSVTGTARLTDGSFATIGPITGIAAGFHLVVMTYQVATNTFSIFVDGTTYSATSVLALPVATGGGDFTRRVYLSLAVTRTGDEVAMWSRVLTAYEIDYIHNSTTGIFGLEDAGDCPVACPCWWTPSVPGTYPTTVQMTAAGFNALNAACAASGSPVTTTMDAAPGAYFFCIPPGGPASNWGSWWMRGTDAFCETRAPTTYVASTANVTPGQQAACLATLDYISFWKGLVHYWPLDETTGTRYDHGPIVADLADNNTVGSAAGMNNLSALFVAANNESLSTADNLGLVGDISFTASCWFRTSGAGVAFAEIIGSYDAVQSWLLLTHADGDHVYAGITDGVGPHQTISLAAASGAWHLAVITYDAGTDNYTLNIDNGAATDTVVHANGLNPAAAGFRVGYSTAIGIYYDGRVDEVAIFPNEVKDAAWIAAMWNAGAGKFY